MTAIPYILGSDSVTCFVDGNSYTVNKQAHTFDLVLDAIKAGDEDALRKAVTVKKTIVDTMKTASDKVYIEDGEIFYEDRAVTGLVASRIFDMLKIGLDVKPMVKFIENLMQNPSKRAVDELFGFLDACNLPITEDGHFLAYKRVRADYKDVHSGTMDNSVGQILSMPRNAVDEDKDRTCSYGLHFCSYSYLRHFSGDRIMVLKINPADVVAIPSDYNNAKGRTCKYEVVDELPLNEYKLPEYELQAGYTTDYAWDDEDYDTEEDQDDYYNDDYVENLDIEETELTPVNKSGKLTPHDVLDIRAAIQNGQSLASIAREFGISSRQVARIRDGEAWRDVVDNQ